jgi:hypothetical protein
LPDIGTRLSGGAFFCFYPDGNATAIVKFLARPFLPGDLMPTASRLRIPARCLRILAFALAMGAGVSHSKPGQARDLASSRDSIKDAEVREYFDYQMGNRDSLPDYLGQKLPAFVRQEDLAGAFFGMIAVKYPREISAGIVKHPFLKNGLIAWSCMPEDTSLYPRHLLRLGVLDSQSLSRDHAFRWLAGPSRGILLLRDEECLRFDFANYALGDLGRAFGLRTVIHSCGAGGSICSQDDIRLFIARSGKLEAVYRSQISFYGNYGGEWNEDGTRQHIFEEENGIIRVLPARGRKVPDLELSVKGKQRKRQRFVWSGDTAYASESPSAFSMHLDGTPEAEAEEAAEAGGE